MVSRAGASFFGDPPAAFANLARATAPGGRLALLTWQAPARNEWFVEITGALAGRPFAGPPPGVPSPFALADPDTVTACSAGPGFTDVQIADVHEPASSAPIPWRPATSWRNCWAGCSTAGTPRRRAAALLATMRAHEGADGITFGSAAWLVTAVRQGV